jgi:nicotinamide-nucleotide amidase
MKVEIVSISNQLLMSDILDTNAAHVSRSLRQVHVDITCKVTVGDDLHMIASVLHVALERADVVITIGGLGAGRDQFTRPAIAMILECELGSEFPGIANAVVLGGPDAYMPGLFIEGEQGVLFCLPANRNELAYLLETEVLPYLNDHLATTTRKSDWLLLRTTGVMASTLKEKLEGLAKPPYQKVNYDSFAGRANIRLWVEAESDEALAEQLNELKEEVLLRLGDHVYGEGDDRLESVVLEALQEGERKLALAECYTNRAVAKSLLRLLDGMDEQRWVETVATNTAVELADYLRITSVDEDEDLARWCRVTAEHLLQQTNADLGLVVYKSVTQGGVQILVTLASSNGVSVTNRSFGGHPDYIDEWACTLGLTHLRRWLLVHH